MTSGPRSRSCERPSGLQLQQLKSASASGSPPSVSTEDCLSPFDAWANHCAFYPGSVMETLKDELRDYDTSKGTIRFLSDNPPPATLVRRLVKARIAKNAAQRRHPAGGAAGRR